MSRRKASKLIQRGSTVIPLPPYLESLGLLHLWCISFHVLYSGCLLLPCVVTEALCRSVFRHPQLLVPAFALKLFEFTVTDVPHSQTQSHLVCLPFSCIFALATTVSLPITFPARSITGLPVLFETSLFNCLILTPFFILVFQEQAPLRWLLPESSGT